MSYFRFVLPTVAAASALLGLGASRWPTDARPTSGAATIVPAHPEEAERLAARAFAELDTVGDRWLRLTLHQGAEMRGLKYEAEGSYLAGPGRRLSLELRTRVGSTVGTTRAACDGDVRWQASRVGDGPWFAVRRLDLRPLRPLLGALAAPLREPLYRLHGLTGPLDQLRSLPTEVSWLRLDRVRREGRELLKLTGTVRSAESAEAWPEGLPRLCRLYLDPRTLWPHRLEWWGPDTPRRGDVPLLWTEFLDPVYDAPPTTEEAQRAFTFEPGQAVVEDQTGAVAGQLQALLATK